MEAEINDFVRILEEFQVGQDILLNVKLDIKPEPNKLEPLLAYRLYREEHTPENSLVLASALVKDKEVVISNKETGEQYLRFAYASGDLSSKFREAPWLLDTFFSMCYGLLLKNLTPPSSVLLKGGVNSIQEETQSET